MQTESTESWFKIKNMTNPISEWQKTTAELTKKIAEQNMEIIQDNVSRLSHQLKRLEQIRTPEDLLNLQKDCITENVTACLDTTQKIIHTVIDNMEKMAMSWGTATNQVNNTVSNKMRKHRNKKSRK